MYRRRLPLLGAAMLCLGAAALCWPHAVLAQAARVLQIGYLANDPDRDSPTFKAFLAAMKETGWAEGKNIQIHYRPSPSESHPFTEEAKELVARKVDVIVTTGSPSTRAAMAVTKDIPIVFGSAANPVKQGFVKSFSRPEGNVTGLSLLVQELGPRRLQLLKELLPHAKQVARMYQSSSLPAAVQAQIKQDDEAAAAKLGMKLHQIDVRDLDDLPGKFRVAADMKVDAVIVTQARLFVVNRELVAKLALANRLAMMGPDGRFADEGALVSYGEDMLGRYRRAAFLVDKILRGSKPADIPVEQPAVLELVVNLRTARSLNINVPDGILTQVDRPIQ